MSPITSETVLRSRRVDRKSDIYTIKHNKGGSWQKGKRNGDAASYRVDYGVSEAFANKLRKNKQNRMAMQTTSRVPVFCLRPRFWPVFVYLENPKKKVDSHRLLKSRSDPF